MGSHAAKEVAREVLVTIGKGKRPNIGKIAVKKGYTPKSANSGQVQSSKSYKSVMQPVVERLIAERDAIIARLPKMRNKAKYRDLIDGLDKVTKNIQLLTGGSTANVLIGVKKLTDDELTKLADE